MASRRELQPDVAAALDRVPEAGSAFAALPPDRQAAWLAWIDRARGRRARAGRIDEMVRRLLPSAAVAEEEVAEPVGPPPERYWWLWLLLLLLLVLERDPTPRLAVAVGAVLAASLLVRPTAFFFLAGVAVAWWMAAGLRRGTLLLGLSVLVMVVLIAPWTARNLRVANDFIPLSMQDSAAYGTFNDDAANDPRSPYAWRVRTTREAQLFSGPPISDAEFRTELQHRALHYIKEHPASLPKAFFWNGLSRTWDIRRPQYAIDEVAFEGRNKQVSIVGIAVYYFLLAAALVALWRLRARRTLVFPLLTMALGASVVFTSAAATRYRLPLEPALVVLASYAIVATLDKYRPGFRSHNDSEVGRHRGSSALSSLSMGCGCSKTSP